MSPNTFNSNNAAATLTQLMAKGALDSSLYNDSAQHPFARSFKASGYFASDWTSHELNTLQFGHGCVTEVPRQGDLVGEIFVQMHLPGLQASDDMGDNSYGNYGCDSCAHADLSDMTAYMSSGVAQKYGAGETLSATEIAGVKSAYGRAMGTMPDCEIVDECPCGDEFNGGNYAYWCNATGYAILREAQILIGNTTIDTHTREFMFIYEELMGFSGKRVKEMVNRHDTLNSLICASQNPNGLQLFVPLQFWFCRGTTDYLPISKMQFHQVQISLSIASKHDLVCVSKPGVGVKFLNDNGMSVSHHPTLTGSLICKTVYLSNRDRQAMAQSKGWQVITQTQSAYHHHNGGRQFHHALHLNLAVRYMNFVVRRDCNTKANNWFNFSGVRGYDPIITAKYTLNSHSRFHASGAFLRLVENYCHANNIPQSFIYSYSFATHYDSIVGQGSLSGSRIDNMHLILDLQDQLKHEQVEIMIFAENLNLLKFDGGLAGPAYSS